jgi:hypothetical protein
MKGTFWNEIAHPQIGGWAISFQNVPTTHGGANTFLEVLSKYTKKIGSSLQIQNGIMGNNDLVALV